jgi:hypothetical protein
VLWDTFDWSMLREVKSAIARYAVFSCGESPAVLHSFLAGSGNHSNLEMDDAGTVKVPGRDVTVFYRGSAR